MFDPDVQRALESTSLAHLATVLPDGAPHVVPVFAGIHGDQIAVFTGPNSVKAQNLRRDPRVALSIAPESNPFEPVAIRGTVVAWVEGDDAWEIIDRVAMPYIGGPYDRSLERIVALITPERQIVGVR
ncbi:MAG: TIGR03618 family F420-dependent PPOX class oxidoreductase [Thermomicrobiales bacterium]